MAVNNPVKRYGSPLPKILLGVGCEAFWTLASLLQIQTSEAFILKGDMVSFSPNWNILMQPIDLLQGKLSASMAKATMWGWGNELVFLICIIGYEMAHDAVTASNRRLAFWLRNGMIAIVVFDGYTDFSYGTLASGIWGQIAFALITSFIVMFFGIVGLRLIEAGLAEWNR
ncbi:MAG TPA: hypothetical protein VGN34_15810 [Ktedonobacteraceae bacterium]